MKVKNKFELDCCIKCVERNEGATECEVQDTCECMTLKNGYKKGGNKTMKKKIKITLKVKDGKLVVKSTWEKIRPIIKKLPYYLKQTIPLVYHSKYRIGKKTLISIWWQWFGFTFDHINFEVKK